MFGEFAIMQIERIEIRFKGQSQKMSFSNAFNNLRMPLHRIYQIPFRETFKNSFQKHALLGSFFIYFSVALMESV